MEFTTEDVKRHSVQMPRAKKLYKPSKDRAAYELCKMKPFQRGEIIERMVTEKIGEDYEHVVSSTQTSNTHPYDIDVTLDCGRKIRVEVKSALYQISSNKYAYKQFKFQNIHVKHFDYIVFVAVTPNGLRAFWSESRRLWNNTTLGEENWQGMENTVYNVRFKDDWSGPFKDPCWLRDMEDFPF